MCMCVRLRLNCQVKIDLPHACNAHAPCIACGSATATATAHRPPSIPPIWQAEQESAKRLRYMFYERLFFKLDAAAGNRGIVDNEHMKLFLAYANFAMDQKDRDEALARADVTGDGSLERWEFVLLAIDTLGNVPMEELTLALDNFNDAVTAGERRNVARWQAAAKSVDIYTRFTLPFAYVTFVIIHYNTDYT